MYIIKNALVNIKRNKGRNILIGLIIIVIAASCAVTLAIRESAEKIISSYEEQNKIDDLPRKKVISKNIKYIVLTEVDDICYCINDVYSPSYIQCIEINKEDIDCIVEELTKEEILRIKEGL